MLSARATAADCARKLRSASPVERIAVLAESDVSQVYRADYHDGDSIVIKRHCVRSAFANEILALTMLHPVGLAPRVYPAVHANVIAMEYMPFSLFDGSPGSLERAAVVVARVHTFANLVIIHQRGSGGRFELGRLPPPDSGLRMLAVEIRRVLGDEYCPAAIGDLKTDHFRRKSSSDVLVDFETFSWGRLEIADLYALSCISVDGLEFQDRVALVAETYSQIRNPSNRGWDVPPQTLMRWILAMHAHTLDRVGGIL